MTPVMRSNAVVQNGRILVVRLRGEQGHKILQRLKEDELRSKTPDIKIEANDDDDGPNHRGTYSKKYKESHPEITWQHRGQGRYLPVETKRNATVPGLLKS